MVNVRLIEKSVNSHVGSVMVANVITQYSMNRILPSQLLPELSLALAARAVTVTTVFDAVEVATSLMVEDSTTWERALLLVKTEVTALSAIMPSRWLRDHAAAVCYEGVKSSVVECGRLELYCSDQSLYRRIARFLARVQKATSAASAYTRETPD